MNWVKKHKLPTIEVIQFNGQLCIKLEDLWNTLYHTFNSTQNWQINADLLDEIPMKLQSKWPLFSKTEFNDAIKKCSISSTSEPYYISWHYLKVLINNNKYISNFVNIGNACINLGFWHSHFKMSTLIIIFKPNKVLYDLPKTFQPIILLNILEELIEKVISKRLQVHSISSNFVHLNQLGVLKQCSTTNIGLYLTYLIHTG